MERVLIVGAGGFGREMSFWLRQHPDCGRRWAVVGFLDDNEQALAAYPDALPIVGSVKGYAPAGGESLICAVALPKPKKLVVESLLSRGARFMTFVHPEVALGGDVHLDAGTILCPGITVSNGARFGAFVTANLSATVGRDASIGDFVTINSHCAIAEGCQVGEAAFFGSHAVVAPGTQVGAWAVVGAGSVVNAAIPAAARVFGNPSRVFM